MSAISRIGRLYPCRSSLNTLSLAMGSSKTLSSSTSQEVEKKIEVDGVNINYLKVGNGPHKVLCSPGALGSIWTDLTPLINNLNRSKFTIIAWDPPGYGKSRPPNRDFSPGFHYRDAECALKLMKNLGIEKYSLLGWSNGGVLSLIMAATSPENVLKLVIWGSNTYFSLPIEKLGYEAFRNHSMLSPKLKAPYIEFYGQELYDELWAGWIDGSLAIMNGESKGDICKNLLSKINCPTFILHGKKDKNIAPEHPYYISKNIKNSRLHVYDEGRHNIHMEYSQDFIKMVEEFLEEKSKL